MDVGRKSEDLTESLVVEAQQDHAQTHHISPFTPFHHTTPYCFSPYPGTRTRPIGRHSVYWERSTSSAGRASLDAEYAGQVKC